ncbi:hypothetical protein G5I_04554 [Acromyrmex echinatior]|uniref:Uncharacterized protein n=1 Tax=Acromyrmex echinatior TaxID=103372 RepID=F4WFY3_ACREC|nr:hypothetical protein G5I_04554 [Acromyrmex echinatior]
MTSDSTDDELPLAIRICVRYKFIGSDEGREKVRVSLLGPQPSPATPGVLLLEPITHSTGLPINMANNPTELLTTHTEHTTPAYHTQIR